ncbi:MAG TPA: HD domain-containing phosphohydrolase [Thermoanaerobaculia bacterium]|nr:HD domain-containing phosphohydrolase [Thermoanaerobaculia bacterium]
MTPGDVTLLKQRLWQAEERIAALNRIGIALSAERDLERLLETILTESRRFSDSEAGSLYLVEDAPEGRRLRFKLAQNDAVSFAFSERTVSVDERSLAGWVAVHGEPLILEDAYALPEGAPYRHNDAFDVATGFRTRAMLVVPMKDHRGELVGVLQLMNRRGRAAGTHERYPDDLVPLLLSLATQAAVCLKANNLTTSIRKLFEDFARAAIVAVEQRDPTTAGHSNRVSTLSVTLAAIVDRAADGPYAAVTFSREELREIGTAALLHDFGKISIPERVLVKAKKLSEEGLGKIRDRFDFSLASEEARDARALLEESAREGRAVTAADLEALDAAAAARSRELEELFQEVVEANEPTVLPKDARGRLEALLAWRLQGRRGRETTLLLPEEFRLLSITQGSLSEDERRAVQSHVSHTWRFLSTIPWTPDLARVPEIAYAHHEKLDGTGYPRGLDRESIPPAVRALTVCDVYDALTASDRPYKRAVRRDAALEILEEEARRERLDSWMVSAFIEGKVWTSLAF